MDKEKYFWSLVNITNDKGECWEWKGSKNLYRGNYGQVPPLACMHPGDRRAHRNALAYTLGRKIKRGKFVIHSCDNPSCCNPKHLREGTPLENTRDMINKNRKVSAKGDRNGARLYPERMKRLWDGKTPWNAKLDSKKVSEIKKMYSSGKYSQRALGKLFGVSQTTIRFALIGKTWR